MSESKRDDFPGAYVAYRDKRWYGCAAAISTEHVKSFYIDFVGCDIRYVQTRDELKALMAELD